MWPRLRSRPITIALSETWLQIAAWISSGTLIHHGESQPGNTQGPEQTISWSHSSSNHPDQTLIYLALVSCAALVCAKTNLGFFSFFFLWDLVSGGGLTALGLIWPCGFVTGNKDLQSELALRHASVRWGAVIPTSETFHLHPRHIL